MLFPKFVDLLPKKSKRCKSCKKFIVQAQDPTKSQGQKLELCHLFLNQFPYCTIFKIDTVKNIILLKFLIYDFKDTKISFEECPDSPVKLVLPKGVFEISENFDYNDNINDLTNKEFIFSKTDRCVILNFKYDLEGNYDMTNLIMRFKIKAEYFRLEVKSLEYINQIKFKI